MNFNDACLNLQITSPFSLKTLKKQYRISALKYHPDKHQPDSDGYYCNKFKTIQESYEFLYKIVENNENDECDENLDYNTLFTSFISSMFTTNNSNIEINKIIEIIIKDCGKLSINLFENMDKNMAIELFEFINTYHYLLYISVETVNKLKDILNEKIKNDNVIILNPNLFDLFNDNIYILDFEKEKYYIPLWHDEIYYKHKGNDLVIKCIPELPENVTIDNNNNIIISLNFSLNEIFNKNEICYTVVDDKKINIKVDDLKITKIQNYILRNQGISTINYNNIYETKEKSNIIVTILIE